jgi:hypothetical protein
MRVEWLETEFCRQLRFHYLLLLSVTDTRIIYSYNWCPTNIKNSVSCHVFLCKISVLVHQKETRCSVPIILKTVRLLRISKVVLIIRKNSEEYKQFTSLSNNISHHHITMCIVKWCTYEHCNSRYTFRFIRNKFTVCCQIYGRAAWAVLSKETRLNPSPNTIILIAVLSCSVSVSSVEYGYGTFKYVITTPSNIITYCLLRINTPLPLVPFIVRGPR